jgi:hypothetical protein
MERGGGASLGSEALVIFQIHFRKPSLRLLGRLDFVEKSLFYFNLLF